MLNILNKKYNEMKSFAAQIAEVLFSKHPV